MIDIHDCDTRLPGLDVLTQDMLDQMPAEEALEAKSLQFMAEFVKLSLLLGRITKAIYRSVSRIFLCWARSGCFVFPPSHQRLLFSLFLSGFPET